MLKLGIMGAGGIAGKFAAAVRLTDKAALLAVASKSPARAAEFAKKHAVPTACSYEELLARPDIDAVYIATTTNFHYENIKACLAAGKHVLCEKAMVPTAAEARELFALARARELFLMEAMWSRFFPSVGRAKEWITSGRIGDVQAVSAVIGYRTTRDPASRLIAAELGGGALYDLGVYMIEIVSYLLGEPILDAVGFCRPNPLTGVDENDSFLLRFPSGDATVNCLFTAQPNEAIVISGTDGRIEIPRAHYNDEAFLYDAKGVLVEHAKLPFPEGNGFVYEIEETARCVAAELSESPIVPHADTLAAAKVYDALLRGIPFVTE